MSRTQLSLVYLTNRPGGIDLLAECLTHQHPDDYELIVVDDWPGRAQRWIAREYLRQRGVPVRFYGTSKPHSQEKPRVGLANAMNTGALHCSTDWVVFLHDFTWLPPGALQQWQLVRLRHPAGSLISGIASLHCTDPPRQEKDVSVWGDWPQGARAIGVEEQVWEPEEFENFYCGVERAHLDATNGIDERADLIGITGAFQAMVAQAKLHGAPLIVDKRLRVIMANHRRWHVGMQRETGLWWTPGHDQAPPPVWEKRSPHGWDFATLAREYETGARLGQSR